MSSHFATVSVDIDNLDSDESNDIAELIESALGGAGYHATVSVTVHEYPEQS